MPSLVELIFTAVGTEEVSRAVGKVNGGLGDMIGQLGRMATTALSVDYAWGKLSSTISEAADFGQLSQRIGETVRDTVLLDQAFRNARLGTELIGTSANMLQRTLGGVTETGAKTDAVLRRVGTSIAELKPLAYAEQLQLLSDGFAKVANQSERVAIARDLFGRGGGQILQLLGDPQALALAEQQAGGLADRIDLNAKASLEFERALNGVTAKVRELWQSMATQLLPTLKSIADLMGGGSSSGLGTFLGSAAPGALLAGGLLAGGAFEKLDLAMLNIAERFQGQIAGGLATAASNVTGILANVMPIGLAAAIVEQIGVGLVEADIEGKLRKARLAANDIARDVGQSQKAVEGISSPAEATRVFQELQAKILALDKEQAALRLTIATPLTRTENLQSLKETGVPGNRMGQQNRLAVVDAKLLELKNLLKTSDNPEIVARIIADTTAKALHESLKPLVDALPKNKQKAEKIALQELDPEDALDLLGAQRTDLEKQQANVPAGLSADEREARNVDLGLRIDEIKKEELALQQKITEEAQKTLAVQDRQYAEAQAALRKEQSDAAASARAKLLQERTALENQLNQIRENLATLEADYTRTDAEKWNDRKAAIAKEIAVLQVAIDADQKAAAHEQAAGHAGAAATFEQSANQNGNALRGALGQQSRLGADPNNLRQQMGAAITSLQNQFGTVQQSIAHGFSSVIGSGIQAAASGMEQLLGTTDYWSQKLGTIGGSIIGTITKSIANLFATWIANELVLAGLKKALGMDDSDEKEKKEKFAAAGFESIAELGPIAGPIAFAISSAAILASAAALPGFEVGGYTGDTGGVTHPREFVLSAPALKNMGGPAVVGPLHAAARAGPVSLASFGNAGGGARSERQNHYHYWDKTQLMRAIDGDLTARVHGIMDARTRKNT